MSGLEGVEHVDVDLAVKFVTVRYGGAVTADELAAAIESQGYAVTESQAT